MTAKSKGRQRRYSSRHRTDRGPSRRASGDRRIDRPFDPAILARARRIVAGYKLVIQREPEVGFFGCSVELPYAMGDGRTIERCARVTTESLILAVASMPESGERPPSPASESKRDVQISIPLTAEERLILDTAAQREGFRSTSDFVRHAALAKAG